MKGKTERRKEGKKARKKQIKREKNRKTERCKVILGQETVIGWWRVWLDFLYMS